MRRPRWILEQNPHFTDPERIRPLVEDPLLLGAVHPLELERLPPVEGPVIAYGSLRCVQRLLCVPGLSEGVLDHHGELRCSRYYAHVYPWLGRAAVLVPLCAMASLPLPRLFGEAVFVRPDDNTKSFSAERVSTAPGAVDAFLRRYSEHRASLVVLSEVVPMDAEYRCFVRRGVVFAHSSYLHPPPYRPAPPMVQAAAEQIARTLMDAVGMTMLTVDIAQSGDTLRLVEVGGVCSWGLYGAEPQAFVDAMEAEAAQRFRDLGVC